MTEEKQVQIVEYDPAWPQQFTAIQKMLNEELVDRILKIEHVGSTSVPGLAGKPILDIDIVISSMKDFPEVKKRLVERLDYVHVGDQGVEGREVFERPYQDEFMTYQLYVCTQDSPPHRYHTKFRDYLRTHPVAMAEYAQLKKALAAKHFDDLMAYFHEKSQFVENILQEINQQAKQADGKEVQ